MTKLTENFDEEEFACPCCRKVVVDKGLASSLQAFREVVGSPVIILSGYRCAKHNAKVGGEGKSLHTVGKAADVFVDGMSLMDMYRNAERIIDFMCGGIGLYPENGFIHLDIGSRTRRWGRLDAKYTTFDKAVDYLAKKGLA